MEPYPLGTVVRYHGSLEYMHGEYTVDGHGPSDAAPYAKSLSPEELVGYYPDGVSYDLWPVGVPHKFCEEGRALYRVRRGSITPVGSANAG